MANQYVPSFLAAPTPSRSMLEVFAASRRYSRALEDQGKQDLLRGAFFFAGLLLFVFSLLTGYLLMPR